MENHRFKGKSIINGLFSVAMLVYQRANVLFPAPRFWRVSRQHMAVPLNAASVSPAFCVGLQGAQAEQRLW